MGDRFDILEPKRVNKIRIAKFISSKGSTSKAEISSALKLSMPTTLQNVKELIEAGLVVEEGEYESTGGRKAKALSIVEDASYAVGVDITNNHITMVMVNARKKIIGSVRDRKVFMDSMEYYESIGGMIQEFIEAKKVPRDKIIGVGLSLPGIVDKEQKLLIGSHVLKVNQVSFKNFGTYISYPYAVDNDANSAAYAELDHVNNNAIFLSLSHTVGGAIYLQNQLYPGENFKSAEFGHMIIERNGRLCYCGKKGCMDAYCAAKILEKHSQGNLELFFDKVRSRDKNILNVWEEYLDYLAIAITNLRMVFDCTIVLGGYVGGYLEEFMPDLTKRVYEYNKFDLDSSYISTGRYKLEASAYGVTFGFIDSFLENV